MNYAEIKQFDVANGLGIRVSIFVSGCTHHCPECFNKVTWDFDYGQPFTDAEIDKIIEYLKPDFVTGLTLLGGEPLEHTNQQGLLPLLRKVREVYPQKDVWCFTGYDFDKDVMEKMYQEWSETKEFLSYLDVLVDGTFINDLKDLSLRFKGSSNQRTILMKQTLASGKIVLWDPSKDELLPLEEIHN